MPRIFFVFMTRSFRTILGCVLKIGKESPVRRCSRARRTPKELWNHSFEAFNAAMGHLAPHF